MRATAVRPVIAPTDLSLVEMADAVAGHRLTSRDLVEAHLDRIAALNGSLSAFVSVDASQARAQADRADAAVGRGDKLGPLHGVPLAHKDMFDRSGYETACGSKIRQGYHAAESATVLKRLEAAGAITLGALAMVEFAMGPHGFNAHLPRCRNPWNADHVPCGSSSGSGVAVAARLVAGALGSDTGGSIRCPASATGVVGLQPTWSRVSRHGVMPMSPSLDTVGPLARTAADCARLLDVIAGPDPLDPTCSARSPGGSEAELDLPLDGLRIGMPTSYFGEGVSGEVEALLEQSRAVLRGLGATLVEVAMPAALQDAADLHPLVMKVEGAASHHVWMRERPDDYSTEVRHRLQAGYFIPAFDYLQALRLRAVLLREIDEAVFSKVDLLHTPVLPAGAPSLDATTAADGPAYLAMVVSLTRNTKPCNYLGLPAISVPCGFVGNGLPASFQLIGRPFSEPLLLRCAHRYQGRTDWHHRAPL